MPRPPRLAASALALAALGLGSAVPAQASGLRAADFELAVPASTSAHAADTGWTSPVLRPRRGFDLVGVRWARKGRPPADVEVRTRRDGDGWSDWVHAGTTHGARGSDPVWAGDADAAQIRLDRRVRVRAHFVAVDGRARAAARIARTSGEQPAIVPREDWGADACPARDAPAYGRVDMAFVHHTVSTNTYAREDSPAMVLGICRYHRNSNGWDDVGYNFLVDRYGTIFEGRAGGIGQAVVGAQAQGWNSVSTGIANLGTHEDVPQTEAALGALSRLIAWKLPLHGAPVTGRVTVTSAGGSTNRHPAGRRVTFERISGHRDGNSTACPGAALYAQLPRLRELAAGRAPATTPPPAGDPGAPASLTLSALDPKLVSGEPARVTGRVVDAYGLAVAGTAVDLQRVTPTGGRSLLTAVTAPDGTFVAEVPLARTRLLRAVAPAAAAPVVSDPIRVTVAPVLTARAPRRVRAGGLLRVRGTIAPTRPYVLVEVARARRNGTFPRVTPQRVRARAGAFATAVRIRRMPGELRVRVRFAGDARNAPARAGDRYVDVVRG